MLILAHLLRCWAPKKGWFISQISDERVEKVSDYLQVGQEVMGSG